MAARDTSKTRFNKALTYRIAFVATLGGFLFGYDTAIINGAILFIKEQFRLTEWQTELAAGSLLMGCVLGASIAGALGDRWGRKKVLLLSAALFTLSSLATALPRSLEELCVYRVFAGIAIGIASMLSPLYIAEISPPSIRGRLVSMNQFAIISGILISYLVGWSLAAAGPDAWRWMFASAVLPSTLFLAALFTVPESPRWLTKEGRTKEALQLLAQLGDPSEARLRLEEIQSVLAEESGSWKELFHPGIRISLGIGIVLAILQQVTGINTILYYGSILFTEQVKVENATAALWANVLIGWINLAFTVVAVVVMDRVGRKTLLVLASGGMGLCLTALGFLFHLNAAGGAWILALILGYVAFFAVGMGPGVWVLLAELFPTKIRARAMSVATICLWAACLLISITFLSLVQAIGAGGAFWLYAVMCWAAVWFIGRAVPETKGKTLEEIESYWLRRGSGN